MLTDKDFIKRLDLLWILARRVLNGSLKADRTTKKKGSGINFLDYAEYNLGDDFRNIDWNIYSRLGELFIRLYEVEEDLTINIILDMSPSMQPKSNYAKKVAAALSYISLKNMDKTAIYAMGDKVDTILTPGHGKNKIFSMLESLERAPHFGKSTNFNRCLKQVQQFNKRPAVFLIISDFFAPDYSQALAHLSASKHEVHCIQVLNPDELSCDWRGDLNLQDIESGATKQLTITEKDASEYARLMAEWNENLRIECLKKNIQFIQTQTNIPFEELIQHILRRSGVVA